MTTHAQHTAPLQVTAETDRQAAAGTRICVSILWIRDSGSDTRLHEIKSLILQQDGVESARISSTRPHFAVLRFRPDTIRPTAIVESLRRAGIGALLVGC